ncbi:MAG: hypothetical protein Sapg2KO_41300 [Saprospiraceae bacterium]
MIALQINNWNEQNQTYQRQQNYLVLIRAEMENNLEALNTEQEKLKNVITGFRNLLALSDQVTDQVSENDLSTAWNTAFSNTMQFKYDNATLTELIAGGVLKEIKNDSIRNSLNSWEGLIQKVTAQEKEVNTYLQKGNDYLEQHGSVRNIIDHNGGNKWWGIEPLFTPQSNKFLLDSPEFENVLVFGIGTGKSLNQSRYNLVEKEMEWLIRKINQELDDR